jgi:acetolactate decarboxylase
MTNVTFGSCGHLIFGRRQKNSATKKNLTMRTSFSSLPWTLGAIALLLASCSQPAELQPFDAKTSPGFTVEWAGALKNMMHMGDLSAKANLTDLIDIEHLYALGAVSNLKGEILIMDSDVMNASVVDDALVMDNSYDKEACLLVHASVANWVSVMVPDDVVSKDQLEAFVRSSASANDIDTNAPFPFLLSGHMPSMDWHVINWPEGDDDHSHEKHVASGLHGTIENADAEILGFYSNSHHAIFTHHTTNMHMHVLSNDIAGHLDNITLGESCILKLPQS